MTLDEAIQHCEEVAEENEKFCYKKGGEGGYFNEDTDWNITKCAAEHRQLAEWMKDYKQLLEQGSLLDKIRAEIEKVELNITYKENYKVGDTWGLRKALEIIDKYRESEG